MFFPLQNQKIFNLRAESSEQIKNVMIAYADDYEEVNTVTAGNVAAVTGLKVRQNFFIFLFMTHYVALSLYSKYLY